MEHNVKKEVSFIVHGKPIGKGRPRFTRSGHTYTPQATKDYERKVSVAAFTAMVEANVTTTDRPVVARIEAYFPIPVSWSKKRQIEAQLGATFPSKPDIDNVVKAALDGCNGIVYDDDAQVHHLVCSKHYAEIGSEGYLSISISWT
jgi:Holliday junction resolvase RusA-like endonuclease